MKKLVSSVAVLAVSFSMVAQGAKTIIDEATDANFSGDQNAPVAMEQDALANYVNTGKNLVYNTGNLLVKIDETIRHIPEATDEKLADFSKCVAVTHASLFRKDSRGEAQAARGQEPVKAVFCSMELGGSVLTAIVDDMASGLVRIATVPLKTANDAGISLMADAKAYLKSRGGDSKGTVGSIVDWIPGSSLVEVGSAGVVFVAGASLWVTSNSIKFVANETMKGYELMIDGADGLVHTGIVVAKNATLVVVDASAEVFDILKDRGVLLAQDIESISIRMAKAVYNMAKAVFKLPNELIRNGMASLAGNREATVVVKRITNEFGITFEKIAQNSGEVILGVVTLPARLIVNQNLEDLLGGKN